MSDRTNSMLTILAQHDQAALGFIKIPFDEREDTVVINNIQLMTLIFRGE